MLVMPTTVVFCMVLMRPKYLVVRPTLSARQRTVPRPRNTCTHIASADADAKMVPIAQFCVSPDPTNTPMQPFCTNSLQGTTRSITRRALQGAL